MEQHINEWEISTIKMAVYVCIANMVTKILEFYEWFPSSYGRETAKRTKKVLKRKNNGVRFLLSDVKTNIML